MPVLTPPARDRRATDASALLVEGPWRHRYVEGHGARLHVAVGAHFHPDQPLVLLIPGFPQFWWAWRAQLPALDAAGYAVAAVDLRGFGASDKTPRGYDPATTAADLAGVVRGLGFASAVLVGHDLGGTAAWWAAAYEPGVVRALAVVSTPHPAVRPRLGSLLRTAVPLLPERRLMAPGGHAVEGLLRRSAARSDFLTSGEVRPYVDALAAWPSPGRALARHRQLSRLWLGPGGRAYRRRVQRRVTVPVLSVRGRYDPLVRPSEMAAAAARTSGQHQLIELPDVGHFPAEEAPAELTRALLTWLATLGR